MAMTSGPVGGRLQIALPPEPGLKPGDTVTVHVIKRLEAGKWAVGIAGRVYPATSDLLLEPGASLRARISMSGGRLALVVSDVLPDAIQSALSRQGIASGGVEETIARALARAGLPLLPETIERMKPLLARSDADTRRGARIMAALIDKGIDPGSPAGQALLPVLGFGDRGGENPRRYRGKPLPDTKRAVKELVAGLQAAPSDRPALLQAYNHLPARSQTWIVIPFVFTKNSERIAGTMKILVDTLRQRPLALSIVTEGLGVHLPLQGKKRSLSVYCDQGPMRRAAEAGLDSLRAKFHNMGLEVDDTIKDGDAFDGYSPIEEASNLPSVDTVG
jgi:hypothetical protein